MSPNGPVTEGRLYVATDGHHPDPFAFYVTDLDISLLRHIRHGRSRDSATGEGEAQLIVSTSQLIQQLASSITSSDIAMNNE